MDSDEDSQRWRRVTAEQFAKGYMLRHPDGRITREPYTLVRRLFDNTYLVVDPDAPRESVR